MSDLVICHEPKLNINGQSVAFKTCECDEQRGTFNASDSETGEYEAVENDKRKLMVSVTGLTRDETNAGMNFFAAPLNLSRGAVIVLQYWPLGDEDPNGLHCFQTADLKLSSLKLGNNAESGGATWNLNGQSNGAYFLPGEVS